MSTRSVRVRAMVLLILSLASLGLIIANAGRSKRGADTNATDLAFRRDAAAQKRDAAALLQRLDRTTRLRPVRVLLATESASSMAGASPNALRLASMPGAVRRHFEGDILLARIEVTSGANRNDLAGARVLLDHGRRGIAQLGAA